MVDRLRRNLLLGVPAALVLPWAAAAQAPLRIEITEGVIEPMPFAAPGFVPDSAAAADLAARITQVVIADLTGTGLFREIPSAAHIGRIQNFDAPVAFADWKAINAQALVTGRSRTLGVVSFDTALYGPASTLLGIEEAAHDAGYGVSIASLRSLSREPPGAPPSGPLPRRGIGLPCGQVAGCSRKSSSASITGGAVACSSWQAQTCTSAQSSRNWSYINRSQRRSRRITSCASWRPEGVSTTPR